MSGSGVNPPFCNLDRFFLRSLARSVPIYRHFQSNRVKWRSLKPWTKFFYLIPYYIKWFFSTLKTSPFDSIWLEISTNWHTTSQGPKKKSIKITKGRIDPCPAHTAHNKGSFTTIVLWIGQRFLSSTVSASLCYTLYLFSEFS